jgi:hypothetical protein
MKINILMAPLVFALVALLPSAGFSQMDIEKDPAYLPIDKYINLKVIHPEVNVNLPRFLLKDVTANLGSATNTLAANGIDLADLVKDVKLIRVLVIDVDSTNRSAMDKAVKNLQTDLESKWTPIVVVPDSNVSIYAMGDASGEGMSGLAVLVYNEGDAVICNVVGHVSIGKLIQIASQSNKFPKDLLKKLAGAGNLPAAPESSSAEKTGDDGTTNAPAAGPNEPVAK